MANEARLKYGAFTLGGPELGGIVHLRSELPELIALGTDAWLEFRQGIPPLGGPHAITIKPVFGMPAALEVTTPECAFRYELVRMEADTAGRFLVMQRTYVSPSYQQFLESRRG